MSAGGAAGRPSRRCAHCGREVVETTHTRTGYRVDYYALHTGEVEPVAIPKHDDPEQTVIVLRLVRPADIYTCVDCLARPAVRAERERQFRPERAGGADATAQGAA